MNNPINNQVFDSRDLIEYRDYLSNQLVELWNEYRSTFESNVSDFTGEEFNADDVNDILGTSGFEYADDAQELYYSFNEVYEDEIKEYTNINSFCEDLGGSPDFAYGEGIIHEGYFTNYCKDLLEDTGYIPKDLPSWIEIDFEATAGNMMSDYTEAQYEGDTYYIRA